MKTTPENTTKQDRKHAWLKYLPLCVSFHGLLDSETVLVSQPAPPQPKGAIYVSPRPQRGRRERRQRRCYRSSWGRYHLQSRYALLGPTSSEGMRQLPSNGQKVTIRWMWHYLDQDLVITTINKVSIKRHYTLGDHLPQFCWRAKNYNVPSRIRAPLPQVPYKIAEVSEQLNGRFACLCETLAQNKGKRVGGFQ